MTTNIFDVVIGKGVLKWDAAWRVIEWLADPAQGHGLEAKFRDRLSSFCLGKAVTPIELKVEYYLGRDLDGTSRHPDIAIGYPDLVRPSSIALIDDLGAVSPNSMRKIDSLMRYAELCATLFPDADRRIVVVTDSTNASRFAKLTQAFSQRPAASLTLLPLQTIGSWIVDIGSTDSRIAQDFANWANAL